MIRPARPAEAPALAALAERAYAPYLPLIGRRPAPMDDDYAARIAAGEAWVWDEQGGIAGLLVLERRADHLWLDNIAVAPEAQGRGLGRRLVRFAVEQAQRLGLPELWLLTNAAMAGNLVLYPRLGFTEVARRRDEGFDRVFFQAKLEDIKA